MASAAHSSFEEKNIYNFDSLVINEEQTEETLEEYRCRICFNILKDCSILFDSKNPLICGHSFCAVCICKWFETTKSCPCCRLESYEIVENVEKRKKIIKLKVHCPNSVVGCTETSQLHKMKDHVKACEYNTISCRFSSCHEKFLCKDRDTHESVCPKRPITCDLCREGLCFDHLETHKATLCPKMIISCPNEDCTETFTRDQKVVHAQSCEFAPVTCTYLGCGALLQRSQVEQHNKTSADAHYAALLEQHEHDKQTSKVYVEQLTAANRAADKMITECKLFKKTVTNLVIHHHPMTWTNTMPANHICDICKQKILPRDGRLGGYRCMEGVCDHDWCEDCVTSMYVPLRPATAATVAAATTASTTVAATAAAAAVTASRIGKNVNTDDINVIGARVTIGQNWRWQNQHRLKALTLHSDLCYGTVIAHAETPGWLRVQWLYSEGTKSYRAGAEGQFDLKYASI
jgi:hypothetical protein